MALDQARVSEQDAPLYGRIHQMENASLAVAYTNRIAIGTKWFQEVDVSERHALAADWLGSQFGVHVNSIAVESGDKLVTASKLGTRVRSTIEDSDRDENDVLRQIPIGSVGTVSRVNHIDSHDHMYFDVMWDNGAWTVWGAAELAAYAEMVA